MLAFPKQLRLGIVDNPTRKYLFLKHPGACRQWTVKDFFFVNIIVRIVTSGSDDI
jgi:hypothetical protein